jgi:hypothetical protein
MGSLRLGFACSFLQLKHQINSGVDMAVKRIKANYMDETGKPSNQQIQLVLGLDSKGKVSAGKEHFGKLIEAVDNNGTLEIYPAIVKVSAKEKELVCDYGSALQEYSGEGAKETENKPMGLRWARLTIVQGLKKDDVLTLQDMDGGRKNFRITKVEDF